MPRTSPEELKKAFDLDPKRVSHILAKVLHEFGYSDLTDDWVEEEIRSLLEEKGETYRGGPSMFLQEWLKEGID